VDYDVVIIGSGFGGSVSAMRLAEKGYSVCVLEAGKRWESSDFPKTNWNAFKSLWFPRLGMRGIQRISLLKDFMALSGARLRSTPHPIPTLNLFGTARGPTPLVSSQRCSPTVDLVGRGHCDSCAMS
jgi:choline dehydrogenase-like flavoprotein